MALLPQIPLAPRLLSWPELIKPHAPVLEEQCFSRVVTPPAPSIFRENIHVVAAA
jgi:hypothetical protein